tara:strand:- start:1444 stop:2448 length:1005 start_codon:yes stop_codon:yes gene_type:complete
MNNLASNSREAEQRLGQPNYRKEFKVAVLIPCLNEEIAIADVISDFRIHLPSAEIYVYDNNSSDETVNVSQKAGAIIRNESLQGKGFVVCRMFADIDADVYVLVDGDGTYDAASAPMLLRMLQEDHLDMVCGARISNATAAYRFGHKFGNRFLTSLVSSFFGTPIRDMLSGYRVMTRRYVKSFPALSEGFEIETQLTVHALEMRMRFSEVDTPYRERQQGSVSKLNTVRDGLRIVRTIFFLVKEEKPLLFFSIIAFLLALSSLVLAYPVITEFIQTGMVPRFPTAILSTGLMVLASLSLVCGLILDSTSNGRREIKRLRYLAIPPLFVLSNQGN